MSRRSQFQRGQGVYDCELCGRKTRGDGDSNNSDLCGQCFELAGQDNYYNDNGVTPTAYELDDLNGLLADISIKGGDSDAVKQHCSYIWPKVDVLGGAS